MAVANTINFADGNQVRPAQLRVDLDGTDSFLTGTDLGCTIVTKDESGTDVDASAAVAYASDATQTGRELIEATCAYFEAQVTSIRCWWSQIESDQYIINFAPRAGVAWTVDISTPVFTPGS